MSKADELRRSIDQITVDLPEAYVGDGSDVCALICDTLGITREMVDKVMEMAASGVGEDYKREGEMVDQIDYALTALLEVAGR